MASSATSSSRLRVTGPEDTIIASKIAVPGLPPWLVSRPRIDERIRAGAQGPLTLVSGPPGAGKTMAIASWAAARADPFPIAWVTLDEYDNRPKTFWSYIVEALRCAGVDIPRKVWASGQGRADYGFLVRLAAAIERHGSPVVLVLDDLHMVTAPRPLSGLAQLLRNAQPSLSVVIASRSDPLLPLHRYRLAGELTEIHADELAFTVDEAGLLMKYHGVRLGAESLAFLNDRAAGWVAPLRLAAISMKHHPDPGQFVKEFATEDGAVAGYLAAEVLNTLPASMRSLLLRTSILERVSVELASELASQESATALPALALANALIQPLGGGWYRYHPLFAEVLRLKLQRESPELVPDLHRRAAEWLRANRTPAEAVRQAAAAGDWQLAARIAIDELAVDQLIEPQGIEPLAEVLQHMPHSQDWSEPQPLLVTAALGLSSAGTDPVRASLAVADGMLDQIPADEEIPSRLARAVISLRLAHRTGDLGTAKLAAADAAALAARIPGDQLTLHPDVTAQVMAGRGAVELWSGHFDQAETSFRAAAAIARNTWQRADCLGHLALLEALCGRLSHAAELALEAAGVHGAGDAKTDECSSRAAMVALAYVHVERNELPEARRWLRHADEALQLRPDKLIGVLACLVAARGSLAQRHAGSALELVARALRGWSPAPWLERDLTLAEARAHLLEENVPAAVDAARRAGAGISVDAAAALAGACLAAGDIEAARQALARVAAAAELAPDHVCLPVWLADAHLAQETGDQARSQGLLERAVRLAESEQLRLPFVIERAWMQGALQRNPDLALALRHLMQPPVMIRGTATRSRAITRSRTIPPGKPAITPPRQVAAAQSTPLIVEKLSEREREVLEHASQMLGTAEIAAEMFVSVNTVKSHLKSIFRKLGAASRNEAVRRARQLQLI